MFISVLDIFKIGVGPSSSHTMGPMTAAHRFRLLLQQVYGGTPPPNARLRCTLFGSLAHTGKGHSTDTAVILGFHNYSPQGLSKTNVAALTEQLLSKNEVHLESGATILFAPQSDIIFDYENNFEEHPNAMTCALLAENGDLLQEETYFSVGGGFVLNSTEFHQQDSIIAHTPELTFPYPFASAAQMLDLSRQHGKSIAQMKLANELVRLEEAQLYARLDELIHALVSCVENGLQAEGVLPGSLQVARRAKSVLAIAQKELHSRRSDNKLLCAYAMAVNEENAAGRMVVTAPTNGAAGVLPAVLYYLREHENMNQQQAREFLLTASAICGLIKHSASISGAEVGCQGEVGSASAISAAGICAFHGGSPEQIENAAEIALEHHLGMTCDPIAGLVQIPCIERNGFGAIKAMAASELALCGTGAHKVCLDTCIETMRKTGLDMHSKYKETSLGGLADSYVAASYVEC